MEHKLLIGSATSKPREEQTILVQVQETNHCAKRAYWWMKGVDKDTAERLGVADKVKAVLSLLQKVDNITMDISITIKQKSE